MMGGGSCSDGELDEVVRLFTVAASRLSAVEQITAVIRELKNIQRSSSLIFSWTPESMGL